MLSERYSYENFVEHHHREPLTTNLARELTDRLQRSHDPEIEAGVLVDELKELGHDLYNFDESDDGQVWCADWVCPSDAEYELIVTISYPDKELPSATVSFHPRAAAGSGSA